MLLWVLILSLFGAAVAAFGGNLPPALRARVLAVQGLIGVGFLAFMLFTSNPFERLVPAPADGNGLNPLLQDPGLAFHPPLLYLGYVGFSMAFSFAIAALIEGRVDAAWARWVRPWTLAAWCFLTLGIALGSWWAYYELGWGGCWFWDPVENASFMPWLVGTALLHSAIVVEKRDALKSWTVLLAILAFSLSLIGTFLVRSGVLTSVHAFATDPARGMFILGFLVIAIGGSLALYAWRAPTLTARRQFLPISREGALVLNNLLLCTAAATVLLGTLYPLFLDSLGGDKVSVGPPFFNATFVPIMVPLFVAMASARCSPGSAASVAAAFQRLRPALAAAIAIVAVSLFVTAGADALAAFGLGLAAWLFVGALVELSERIKLLRVPGGESLRLARNLPRAAYGMTIAHIGVAIAVAGVTASSAWQSEAILSHAARRQHDDRRLHRHLRRCRNRARAQLPGAARRLHRHRGRQARRADDAREARLCRRAQHHDRGRDPHHLVRRSLRRAGRSRPPGRLGGAALSQPAGGVDLDRRARHVRGRAALAQRPAPARRRAPAQPQGRDDGRRGTGARLSG